MKYTFSTQKKYVDNYVQAIIDEVNCDIKILQDNWLVGVELTEVLTSLKTMQSLADRVGNRKLSGAIEKRIIAASNRTMIKVLFGELGQNE